MYKLTSTGWIKSCRVFLKEPAPETSQDSAESAQDDDFDRHQTTIQNKDIDNDEESMNAPV